MKRCAAARRLTAAFIVGVNDDAGETGGDSESDASESPDTTYSTSLAAKTIAREATTSSSRCCPGKQLALPPRSKLGVRAARYIAPGDAIGKRLRPLLLVVVLVLVDGVLSHCRGGSAGETRASKDPTLSVVRLACQTSGSRTSFLGSSSPSPLPLLLSSPSGLACSERLFFLRLFFRLLQLLLRRRLTLLLLLLLLLLLPVLLAVRLLL